MKTETERIYYLHEIEQVQVNFRLRSFFFVIFKLRNVR